MPDPQLCSEEEIATLVQRFYARVRRDAPKSSGPPISLFPALVVICYSLFDKERLGNLSGPVKRHLGNNSISFVDARKSFPVCSRHEHNANDPRGTVRCPRQKLA